MCNANHDCASSETSRLHHVLYPPLERVIELDRSLHLRPMPRVELDGLPLRHVLSHFPRPQLRVADGVAIGYDIQNGLPDIPRVFGNDWE